MEKAIFLRTESFAMQASKSRWNAQQIIDELIREPNSSLHVAHPKPPNLLYGIDPKEALKEAQERWQEAKKYHKKNTKKTTKIILSGVASWPENIKNYCQKTYEKWKENLIKWLKNRYKENLKSIVEHLDENHPHIHFLALAPLNEKKEIDMGAICQGYAIKKEGKKNKSGYKEISKKFTEKMREMRQDYFINCGFEFGHLLHKKITRKRVSRATYHQISSEKSAQISALNNELLKAQSKIKELEKFKEAHEILTNKKAMEAISSHRFSNKKLASWVRD